MSHLPLINTNKYLRDLNENIENEYQSSWFAPYDGKKGFPVHHGNKVTPLYDGKTTFEVLQKEILSAKHSIHIAVWSIMPGMRLVRGKNTINSNSSNLLDSIGDVIFYKCRQNVQVKLLLWSIIDNLYLVEANNRSNSSEVNDVVELAELFENHPYYRDNWLWWQNTNNFDNLEIRYQSPLRPFGANRQSTVVIDNKLGFCMGCNLRSSDWDDQDQSVFNPLRDPAFGPRHDLAAMVEGPIVKDLEINFAQRWIQAGVSTSKQFTVANEYTEINPSPFPIFLPIGKQALTDDAIVTDIDFFMQIHDLTTLTNSQGIAAQIIRTLEGESEKSIREVYINAIANARHYIYIENQVFRDQNIADAIADRILATEGRIQVVIIVSLPGYSKNPTLDDFNVITNAYEKFGIEFIPYVLCSSLHTSDIHVKIIEHLNKKYAQSFDFIDAAGILWGQESKEYKAILSNTSYPISEKLKAMLMTKLSQPRQVERVHYRPIDSQVKLLIIDDHFITFGSANINKRSMNYDSEINIAITNPTLAKEMRIELWNRKLDYDIRPILGKDNIKKGITHGIRIGAQSLKEASLNNEKHKAANKLLNGTLLPLRVFTNENGWDNVAHYFMQPQLKWE